MTKPRPWPTKALWAKDDSIDQARTIDHLGDIAVHALDNHNPYKAKAAIREMQLLAKRIEAALLAASQPAQEDNV